MKKFLLGGLAFLLTLSSCKKDEPDNPDNNNPGIKNVLVINEGAFQAGNASLGVYNLETNAYAKQVFAANNNRPLGDVFQSVNKINGELYLVVNNSGKIEVINPDNFVSTATINGLISPRYILPVNNSQAFVSDLFSDSIAVIDLTTKSIDGYINISSTSEQMVKVNNKVYITNTYTSQVTVVDISTKAVKTITTTFNPTAIGVDANNRILVLCGGDAFGLINGSLDVIDPSTDQVIQQTDLGAWSYTNQMAFNGARDSVYILTGNVYKMAVTASTAPSAPFIDGSNRSFYGIGYNTDSDELWLGDARDFNQNGEVLIYNRAGQIQSTFTSGISPNGFYFNE